MARTSSALGTMRSMASRPTGTIIAPPMPWKIRAATSSGKVCAMPQQTEPRVKTRIAARNTVRAPNRSAVQPDSGMKIARLRRYEVMARLSRSGSSSSAAAMRGIATAITVESTFCMKSAPATISGTMVRRGRCVAWRQL